MKKQQEKRQVMGCVVTFDELVHYLETGYVVPSPYTSHADWACSIWNGWPAAVDALAKDMCSHGFSILDQASKYYHKLMERNNLNNINTARHLREHEILNKQCKQKLSRGRV